MILTLLLLFAMNNSVLAQDDEDEERDLLEVVVFAGAAIPGGGIKDWALSNGPEIGAKTGLSFGGDIGYFLTSNIVMGINFTYSQHTHDTEAETGGLKHRFYNPSFYLKYYFFGESSLIPYVKAHAGADNSKFATQVYDRSLGKLKIREISYDPIPAFGIGAGLFYYTSDYSGLYFEANFHYALSEDNEGTYQNTIYRFTENYSMIDIHAGVAVFFGSD